MKQYSGQELFQRTALLLGEDVLEAYSRAEVIIFGLGGVGSWCAEGLVRSGVRKLTIVDSDTVNPSNVNRQLMATVPNIGRSKAQALRERLLEINPDAEITAVDSVYSAETASDFHLDGYTYVIDAIDTLKNKAHLILEASSSRAVFFSSMGAALKLDPCRVKVAEFWKVRDCPLGAILRKKFRRNNTMPAKPFLCVYGDEVLQNRGDADREALDAEAAASGKAVINGTTAPVTAIFGMTLAGLVLKDLYCKTINKRENGR